MYGTEWGGGGGEGRSPILSPSIELLKAILNRLKQNIDTQSPDTQNVVNGQVTFVWMSAFMLRHVSNK